MLRQLFEQEKGRMAQIVEAEVLRLENPKADDAKLKQELHGKVKACQCNEQSSNQVQMSTYLTNLTNDFLRPIESHVWVGRLITGFSNLPSGYYSVPQQGGTLPQGVKWGVVYANGTDSTARKWVVAYDSTAQKAYAEAGPIGPVDWNVVEVKLGMSTNNSVYVDPALGGQTNADIDGLVAHGTFRH